MCNVRGDKDHTCIELLGLLFVGIYVRLIKHRHLISVNVETCLNVNGMIFHLTFKRNNQYYDLWWGLSMENISSL